MSTSQFRVRALSRVREITFAATLSIAAFALAATTKAQHMEPPGATTSGHAGMIPAPAGVMGAHVLPAGKVMLMYTPMWMHMDDSRIGTREVSPEEIVTTVPNRFRMMPGQPPTLRIAPDSMDMRMQMLGATVGITDHVSLMAMGSYVQKEMDMITFAGPTGTRRLAVNHGETEGIGDTTLAALVKLFDGGGHRLHAIAGLSLPTGSIEEEGRMISPMGMPMIMRSSYGMQLGTGTYDLVPGLMYTGQQGPLAWGASYRGRFALEDENEEGYSWGDRHELTGWLAYALNPLLSGSLRVAASTEDEIDGRDPRIMGAFQGTHPEFYGGERVEVLAGLNARGHVDGFGMLRLGLEAGVPVYQNLNGPQLERDWSLTLTLAAQF
jgi:hypothetical protein